MITPAAGSLIRMINLLTPHDPDLARRNIRNPRPFVSPLETPQSRDCRDVRFRSPGGQAATKDGLLRSLYLRIRSPVRFIYMHG